MNVASIDIGTNTVLLLIARIDDHGNVTRLHEEQRTPRLGKDVDAQGHIGEAAIDRVTSIISAYATIAQTYGVRIISASATSAVRDAENGGTFAARITKETGVKVEILSGDAEAVCSYRGALTGITPRANHAAVIDIGGGSTELIFPKNKDAQGTQQLEHHSFQIGAVRMTERFLTHRPPLETEIAAASLMIAEKIAAVRNPGLHSYELIGVAGTVTTLACLDLRLNAFDIGRISGHRMSIDTISHWLQKLSLMTPDQIASLSAATLGREDILLAGVLILHDVMKCFGMKNVTVSERGLRYGYALVIWERATARKSEYNST